MLKSTSFLERREFTCWRIFWYAFAFFYGVPVVLVVGMFVVLWLFGVSPDSLR